MSRTPKRRPRPFLVLRAVLVLSLAVGVARFSLSGCESATMAPEPSADEVAYALSGAMLEVADRGLCDETGTFWLDNDTWNQAMTGRSTGTAGVIEGLLAGLEQLAALGGSTRYAEVSDRVVAVVRSSATWLMNHAEVDTEVGGLSWPVCVEASVPAGAGISGCPEGVPTAEGIELACADGLDQALPGLRFGVAGIGDAFLDLADHPLFTDKEQSQYLSYAQGAGDWLLAHAVETDFGTCWPDTLPAGNTPALCDTSMARGLAGIGWFLVRLSQHVPDGTPYLNGAMEAAATMESMLVPADDGTQDVASLPVSDQDSTAYTGFYEGNAGAAYFLMTLYQQTGRSEYGALARSILGWLESDAVMHDALDGLTWAPSPFQVADGSYTGWEYGVAGTGWTFLQAARVFGTSATDPDPEYLDIAGQAATWLTHPEIAHYYQGLVWWPVQDSPWRETPTLPAPSLSQLDPIWSPADQPWWVDGSPRAYLYDTGLLRGGAGIGWFLLELSDTLRGQSGWSCYQDLFQEASSQALRWLYYTGESPNGDGRWRWPASGVRTIDAQDFPAEPVSGYELGISGTLTFLGTHMSLSNQDDGSGPVPFGFPPLRYQDIGSRQ